MSKSKMKKFFALLILASFLALAGCNTSGTDKSKELELKERELALKEKELELNRKSSKDDDSDKTEKTKKTEAVKATNSPGSKGCQPTNTVIFKKGMFGQTFKCTMNAKNSRHKYTLNAKAGQMFDIQFETIKQGLGNGAVYTIEDPNGLVKSENVEGNSGLQFDKTGNWTVTVDLDSSATKPVIEYTITFTIGDGDIP